LSIDDYKLAMHILGTNNVAHFPCGHNCSRTY
jgi:hypothetical protein